METTEQRAGVKEGEGPGRGALHGAFAALLELGIEWLVRLTGRKIRRSDAPWLNCYLSDPGLIGTEIYQRIAEHEQLKLRMPPTAGLIPDFEALRGPSFDPGAGFAHPAFLRACGGISPGSVERSMFRGAFFFCGCWWSF